MFVYFGEGEGETKSTQVGKEQRETENPKQALGSELSAQSPTRGSNPRTVRSWPELKSRLRCLIAWDIQAPPNTNFNFVFGSLFFVIF